MEKDLSFFIKKFIVSKQKIFMKSKFIIPDNWFNCKMFRFFSVSPKDQKKMGFVCKTEKIFLSPEQNLCSQQF